MEDEREKLVDAEGEELTNTPPKKEEEPEDLGADQNFVKLAKTFDATAAQRDAVIDKLFSAIMATEANLNLNQSSKDLEAKMVALSTFGGLLKDKDNQAKDLVKLKLAKEEQNVNGASAKLITECLYKLSGQVSKLGKGNNKDPLQQDDDIEKIFAEKCEPILPGELIEHTEAN